MENQMKDSKFKLEFGYSLSRFVATTAPQNIMNAPKLLIHGSRNWLSEPWNFVNHSGNAAVSAYVGLISGWWGGVAYEHFRKNNDEASAKRRARAAMAASGLVFGFLANAATETRLGLKLSHLHDTPDSTDLIYGVTSSVYAAVLGPDIKVIYTDDIESTSEEATAGGIAPEA